MKENEQRRAAKAFAEKWLQEAGYEKGQTQMFWTALLRDVFGVSKPEEVIEFEDQVKLGSTKFIDARIPSTRVLIEQKGAAISLTRKGSQSDKTELTPFEQARRYVMGLPLSEHPRWIVVCNFREFHVHDMERPSDPPQIIELKDLEKEFYRLRFLVDSGSTMTPEQLNVSVEAGALVGEIYDALLHQYKTPDDPQVLRSLNILCVRLVFCLYAEDAGLFNTHSQFHDYLKSLPVAYVRDGLRALFRTLNTKLEDRDPDAAESLNDFPYVNGGLFADESIRIPQFSQEIFDLLLHKASENFDWSQISPTIFGAVFESTLNPETRRKGGMHYTSVDNIHKVIDPLFLDGLKKEFADIQKEKSVSHRTRKLKDFQNKLASLTFLDPACGSGNFLTETYICLRRLENDVIRALLGGQSLLGFEENDPVKVGINQFYGIEINDFAVSVAQTALWIAESQMLKETEDIINRNLDFLPLKSYTNIHEGNALRMSWEDVISGNNLNYIMGNPPFLGYSNQSKEQKEDMLSVFSDENGVPYHGSGKIDYVTGWYFKASQLMQSQEESHLKAAFVSTNSITQGEQVAIVWRPIFKRFGIHFDFAYRSFVWDSEATDKAHVHCVIIGFSNWKDEKQEKKIFDDKEVIVSSNINPYLVDAKDAFIEARRDPLVDVPDMLNGGKPAEGGNLILTVEEKDELLKLEPQAAPLLRPFMMGKDFIDRRPRFCLWLVNADPSLLKKCPRVEKRIEAVRQFRLESKKQATREKAQTPSLFDEVRESQTDYLALPKVSSENREYIPLDWLSREVIPGDMLFFVPNATLFLFGVLTSSVHMAWMRATTGRLKSDYRYSSSVVYNNFIWPTPNKGQTEKITETAQRILDIRAKYSSSSLADLYDTTTMPPDLLKAHLANDKAVLAAYGLKADATEQEVVSFLMERYLEKVNEVENRESIDAAVSKVIGKKAETVPDWMQELRAQCLAGKITTDELIAQGKAKKKAMAAAMKVERKKMAGK